MIDVLPVPGNEEKYVHLGEGVQENELHLLTKIITNGLLMLQLGSGGSTHVTNHEDFIEEFFFLHRGHLFGCTSVGVASCSWCCMSSSLHPFPFSRPSAPCLRGELRSVVVLWAAEPVPVVELGAPTGHYAASP